MEIKVDTRRVMRQWPHVEKYHNTTLRYTPDGRFPAVFERTVGKPEIIRLFVTLDEVWECRAGIRAEYFRNAQSPWNTGDCWI